MTTFKVHIYESLEEYEELLKSGDMWDDKVMERDYRRAGKKVFSAQVHSAARTQYFISWAATRLGLSPEQAKGIIDHRLSGGAPSETAAKLATLSSISEVRNSCETYLNDLK
jgi:hypothetical protein